jgi:site-specific recombinase XerD
VPFGDAVAKVLREQKARQLCNVSVFPSSRTRRGYASWPKLTFSRIANKAGLKGGPHTLRHTYASHFLQTQPDLFLLAEVLGHSSTKTTKI